MIDRTIAAIVLFGILVFIHELGHFLVAKLSGVFVERFALGFGPALLRKKWGETEYAICALPLGGYVKMRGEEMEGDEKVTDPRSFASKSVWTRFAIVFMGPLSNLILPVVVFWILFWVGTPVESAKIGSVIPGYPAQEAGLLAGDRILEIQGRPVKTWKEMTASIQARANQPTNMKYLRDGKENSLTIVPIADTVPNVYGENQTAGRIGVDLQPYRPVAGISYLKSLAAKAGLRTGDVIASVNGVSVSYWWQLAKEFSKSGLKTLEIERMAGEKAEKITIKLPRAGRATLAAYGIENGDLFIREVKEDSIAFQKGLRSGDKIVSLNKEKISNWYKFRKIILGNKGDQILLGILRNEKPLTLELIPREVTQKDELTKTKRKVRQLGVVSYAVPAEVASHIEKYPNPFKALQRGLRETVDISKITIGGLGRLVTGRLPLNSLGGPIQIFYLAGKLYKIGGLVAYLRLMAVLSITLAIINFLPIPVLDGGHLFFFIIEAIKGSPVRMKIRHFANQVGLVIILGIMLLAIYVDINRFLVDPIKSLFN